MPGKWHRRLDRGRLAPGTGTGTRWQPRHWVGFARRTTAVAPLGAAYFKGQRT